MGIDDGHVVASIAVHRVKALSPPAPEVAKSSDIQPDNPVIALDTVTDSEYPRGMHNKLPRSSGSPSRFLLRAGYSFSGLLISFGLCSGGQMDASGRHAPLKFKIPPGASSMVSFSTAPNAQCLIREGNAKASGESLPVFADDGGTVVFYAEAEQRSGGTAKLIASCSSQPEQTIEIQAIPGAKAAADNPIAPGIQGTRYKHIRPALSGDPMSLSTRELVSRGYPARPDPQKSPDAYASWLRAVSKPATQIEPKLISMPNRFHGPLKLENGPAGSSNWSGYALVGTSSPFDFISGNWNVPATAGSELNQAIYSALWIGLDGDASNNVVQDGTGQDVLSFISGSTIWTIRSYYGWKEICCQEPEVRFSNFPIYPGDEISSYVWMADSSGNISAFGGIAYFWFEDITSGQYAYVSTTFTSGVFSGNSAEWILERPTISNNLTDLADYVGATVSNPWVHRADNRWYGYTGGDEITSQQITMFNGANALSTVSPVNVDHMQFQWLAYH